MSILLGIKESLRTEKSQYISLDLLYDTIVSKSPRLMFHVPAIMRHEKRIKDLISPGVLCQGTVLEIRILNLSSFESLNGEWQTHWKLGAEILIDQFSS